VPYIIPPLLPAFAFGRMLGLVLLGCFDDPLEFFRSLRPCEGLTGVVVMGKEFQQKVLKLL
jgi:hypothetical protein